MIKKLLSKIPLEKVMALAMRFGLLNKPLEAAVGAWKKAQGVRSQACVVLGGGLAAAAFFGVLPWDAVLPLISLCAGAAGPAMAEKWEKSKEQLQAASAIIEAKAIASIPVEGPPAPPK